MIEIYTDVYIRVNKYVGVNIIFLSNAPVSLFFSASLTGRIFPGECFSALTYIKEKKTARSGCLPLKMKLL